MRRRSVRARLAFWHTTALALVLGLFAVATYLHLASSGRQRVDRSLTATADAFTTLWRGEIEHERLGPFAAAAEAAREFRYRDRRVLVYDSSGRLIAASGSEPAVATTPDARPESGLATFVRSLRSPTRRGDVLWGILPAGEHGMRARVRPVFVGAPFTLVVLRSLAAENEATDSFLEGLMVAVPLALALSGLGGYLLARASLAPVTLMADRADRISASNLHERLPVATPGDELGHLGAVFNRLLERLDRAFEQQRRFMADASHELRTPVAALRSAADVTLGREGRTSAEYEEALRVASAEGRRLARIVDDLFLLARADAGQQPVRVDGLYLEEVVSECARSARALAGARRVYIEAPPAEEAPFRGDEALLKRALMNLLDNGIKHTPAGGSVTLVLDRDPAAYRIRVRDTGPGVPEAARPHIFERFYRADAARSRGSPAAGDGAGLGLAIARWIAEAHGGTLTLEETGPAGSTFVLALPVPAAPDDGPDRRRITTGTLRPS